MTLDSSALIAILFAEHGHLELLDRILAADHVRVGAPTVVETSMVFMGRRLTDSAGEVDALLKELEVTIVPFGEPEWRAATTAFRRFGRKRHAAGLNYGDCLSYAAAAAADDSLLFVGDDFPKTDITAA